MIGILTHHAHHSNHWEHCANLFEFCEFEGQRVVRIGSENNWEYEVHTDGTICNPRENLFSDTCEILHHSKSMALVHVTSTMNIGGNITSATIINGGSNYAMGEQFTIMEVMQ